MRTPACERNMAGPEEDIGIRVAYVPCGRPAPNIVVEGDREWRACGQHAREAERDGCAVAGVVVEVSS